MRFALITTVCAVLEASALAAPTPESPETLYHQGQAAFERAEYATAIAKWQASYKLSGASGLLFNVAQAYRLSGDCKRALAIYERFVASDLKADKRPLAIDFIGELEPTCGPDPDREPQGPIARPGRTMKIVGLTTGGAGVILFAFGLGYGHRASTLGDEVTTACAVSCEWSVERVKESAGRRYATIGKVLDGVGLVAIAVGVGLYLYGAREIEPALAIQPHSDGATLTWSDRW